MRISGWSSDVCSSDLPEVRLAMARILMARYANRISSMQASLFEDFDPDPKTPLKADAAIAEAARVQLYAGSGRALHYGFDTLCDASNENRSEEHTSELQSLMRISYAVFCLKKKKKL